MKTRKYKIINTVNNMHTVDVIKHLNNYCNVKSLYQFNEDATMRKDLLNHLEERGKL